MIFLLASTAWGAQAPPDFSWARRAGTETEDECRGLSIAASVSGEVCVTGFFSGSASFGPTNIISGGLEDICLARYDALGNLRWVRKAGGTGYDEGSAVAVDAAGNVFVAGLFQGAASFGTTNVSSSGESDGFLAKYSPSGTLLWVRKIGATDFDEASGLALDASGDAYLTGYFNLKATFGGLTLTNLTSSNQLFVAKCSATGTFLWARRAGGAGDIAGAALAVDAATNVFVTGSFGGSINFGTTNLVAAGANGANDIFVARYDPAGNLVWVRQAGGTGNDEGAAITTDSDGNVAVTGKFSSPAVFGSTNVTGNGVDIFVARYNRAGDLLWVRKAGGNNSIYGDAGLGIAMDPADQLLVSGFFSGTASFGSTNVTTSGFQDVFVAAYRDNGDVNWVRKAGGGNLDIGAGLAVDNAGNVLLTGFFTGTAAFGRTNLTSGTSGTSRDIFVTKMASAPPVLGVAKSARGVQLTWPAAASDYRLQNATALPAALWNPVTAPTNIVGRLRVVEWTNAAAQSYFRLSKP